jgi:hypothetical protein
LTVHQGQELPAIASCNRRIRPKSLQFHCQSEVFHSSAPELRTLQAMYHGEPTPNAPSANRPIRMLPFALAAGLGVYLLAHLAGAGETWSPVLAAIAGGWTLGRLTRR